MSSKFKPTIIQFDLIDPETNQAFTATTRSTQGSTRSDLKKLEREQKQDRKALSKTYRELTDFSAMEGDERARYWKDHGDELQELQEKLDEENSELKDRHFYDRVRFVINRETLTPEQIDMIEEPHDSPFWQAQDVQVIGNAIDSFRGLLRLE